MTEGLIAIVALIAAIAVYRFGRAVYLRRRKARLRRLAEHRAHFAEIERLGPDLYFRLMHKESQSDDTNDQD